MPDDAADDRDDADRRGGAEGTDGGADETRPDGESEYGYLVRDRVPDLLDQQGLDPETHVADDAEFRDRLAEKLVAEARKYEAKRDPEALADVLAVVGAICRQTDVDREELEQLGREAAMERGTFEQRYVLDRVRE